MLDGKRRIDAVREVAREVLPRIKHRDAQLRTSFVERRDARGADESEPTPLALMMRGGRGGEVRLKLLLSVLWIAVQPPHDVTFPARVWAELIGLPEPETSGARRVRAAFVWLTDHGFLRATRTTGKATTLTVQEESLRGVSYTVPGAKLASIKATNSNEDPAAHRYIKVPRELWENGWIAVLTTPALAMLLVLLTHSASGNEEDLWFSVGFADARYRLSEDTRIRGLNELRRLELVTVRRKPIGRNRLDVSRLRNTYTLRRVAFEQPPSPLMIPAKHRDHRSQGQPETEPRNRRPSRPIRPPNVEVKRTRRSPNE